ncbi:hypothetical protein UlMin_018017 [Ulmus minor]
MKKLYRKGTVHPSPPIISDHLAFLPATILALTVALSPEDREVLAYLISCSNSSVNFSTSAQRKASQKGFGKGGGGGCGSFGGGGDHPPLFNCYCFRCYMSYWARWDSSPNRQLIHEIIDGLEEELQASQSKGSKNSRKERRKRGGCGNGSGELKRSELSSGKEGLGQSESAKEDSTGGDGGGSGGGDGEEESSEKGSVRRFVSFIGERIWGVWN